MTPPQITNKYPLIFFLCELCQTQARENLFLWEEDGLLRLVKVCSMEESMAAVASGSNVIWGPICHLVTYELKENWCDQTGWPQEGYSISKTFMILFCWGSHTAPTSWAISFSVLQANLRAGVWHHCCLLKPFPWPCGQWSMITSFWSC